MAGTIKTVAKAREASINAVVTRANGTVEDLGTVAYWHRNPLRRLWWRLTQTFGRNRNGR